MKRLSILALLLCLSYIFVCVVEQPISYGHTKVVNKDFLPVQENNKYIFSNKVLKVEVTSLNKQGANVVMSAKYKNLRNNPFRLSSEKKNMYLLDDDGERWVYDDDDYGFTFLKSNFEFMPDTWHKITFQFNKPEGSTKSTSFTFFNKVQINGSFDMINISVKNIPDGYGS